VPRRWLKRTAAVLLLAVLLAAALIGGGGYAEPDPALCDALRTQSESTPDVAYAMEERGCPDPPFERLSTPDPDVLGRAGQRGGDHG
jgi:hypothetical protein